MKYVNRLGGESAYMGAFLLQPHLSVAVQQALKLDARLVSLSAVRPSLREGLRFDVRLVALCYNMSLCNQNKSGGGHNNRENNNR
jgi:hypothetical protein